MIKLNTECTKCECNCLYTNPCEDYIFALPFGVNSKNNIRKRAVNDARFGLFLKKTPDNTGCLILHGKDLHQKFHKRIRDGDIFALCRFIKHHPRRINILDLRYNRITDEGFFMLLKKVLVKERSSITELNIMNNNLTHISIENLAKYAKFVRLKKLRLNGNLFGTEGGIHLACFLLDNTSLEYVDVGETNQTLKSIAPILGSLHQEQGGNKTLKALDLSRAIPMFDRYSYETKYLADQLESLIMYNATLTDLYLQKNQLTGHDMEYLVRGLKVNTTLTCLDLGYNVIGDKGAEELSSVFKTTPLTVLNIAGNSISDTGARVLSMNVPFSKIRALDLSNNHFTDEGILDILNTIKKPPFTRFVNLWGNKFGQKSCEVIERMMYSKVLCEHSIDVRVYEADEQLFAAYCPNPIDRSKHLYFWKYGQVQDMIKTHFDKCHPEKKMYCMPGPDGVPHYARTRGLRC